MLITDNMNCYDVMLEFATRFKQHRIASHLTQKDVADKTGVGLRTIARFEKGEEIGMLTFIKLLQGVGLEHNLENIIPDYTRRPSYFANDEKTAKRARKNKAIAAEWKWGEDL